MTYTRPQNKILYLFIRFGQNALEIEVEFLLTLIIKFTCAKPKYCNSKFLSMLPFTADEREQRDGWRF